MRIPNIRLLKFLCLAFLPGLAVAREKTPVEQARILAKQGQAAAPEIVTLLLPEIEAHPENAEAHRCLAEAYVLQSEWRRAIEQYDALLALNEPKQVWDPELILLKAEALANSAQHQTVIELLEANAEKFRKTRKHRSEFENRLREARDEVLMHVAIPDLNLARDMGLSSGVDRRLFCLGPQDWKGLEADADLGPCIALARVEDFDRFTLVQPLPDCEEQVGACIFHRRGKAEQGAIWQGNATPSVDLLRSSLKPTSHQTPHPIKREVWRRLTTGTVTVAGREVPVIEVRKGQAPAKR